MPLIQDFGAFDIFETSIAPFLLKVSMRDPISVTAENVLAWK